MYRAHNKTAGPVRVRRVDRHRRPAQRLFYSLTGILVSLGTWLTSNLGGFFLGLLLGAVGSCLTFGWLPDQEPRISRRRRRRARAAERGGGLGEGAGEPA